MRIRKALDDQSHKFVKTMGNVSRSRSDRKMKIGDTIYESALSKKSIYNFAYSAFLRKV
jgi:hypothetical protein